jgi:multiple sugar transport system permease protein
MAVDLKASPKPIRKIEAGRWWARFLNSDSFTAIVFLAIPLIMLVLTKFYPIIYNVVISFTNYDLSPTTQFVGLKNYAEIFSNEVLLKSIWNTLLFAVGVVPAGTVIALVIAALLNQHIHGRVLFRTLYYLPGVTAVTATALVWRWIFNPQSGLINQGLDVFGITGPGWLTEPSTALISIVIIQLWGSIGGNMVVFLAGLQGIPAELYEAAEIDGARGWQSFLYITVPMLSPVTLFVVVTYTIAVFRSFGLTFLLTQGGPSYSTTTLVWEIYETAFGYLRFGLGAAISVILLLTVLLLSVPFRLLSREEAY